MLLLSTTVRGWSAARQALREQDETLGLALAAARIGVWDLDLGARTVACSRQLRDLFGLDHSAAPVPVETFLARVHPDDWHHVRQVLEGAARQVSGFRTEFRVVGANGAVRWLLAKGAACPERGALRVLGVTVDVSERKQAEALAREEAVLRDSEARWKSAELAQRLWREKLEHQVALRTAAPGQ
jgi:PAS domain S-box-containing protein